MEFVNFLKANGCTALKLPPYHSQFSGIAKGSVQTVKTIYWKKYLRKLYYKLYVYL